jgi:hypothetical protein
LERIENPNLITGEDRATSRRVYVGVTKLGERKAGGSIEWTIGERLEEMRGGLRK